MTELDLLELGDIVLDKLCEGDLDMPLNKSPSISSVSYFGIINQNKKQALSNLYR